MLACDEKCDESKTVGKNCQQVWQAVTCLPKHVCMSQSLFTHWWWVQVITDMNWLHKPLSESRVKRGQCFYLSACNCWFHVCLLWKLNKTWNLHRMLQLKCFFERWQSKRELMTKVCWCSVFSCAVRESNPEVTSTWMHHNSLTLQIYQWFQQHYYTMTQHTKNKDRWSLWWIFCLKQVSQQKLVEEKAQVVSCNEKMWLISSVKYCSSFSVSHLSSAAACG